MLAGVTDAPLWTGETVVEVTTAIAAVSELAVLRALERANKRLERRSDRSRLRDVPPWELHTHVSADPDRLEKAMVGVWDLPAAAGLPEELLVPLDSFTRTLLSSGHPFDRDDLHRVLTRLHPQPQLSWEPGAAGR